MKLRIKETDKLLEDVKFIDTTLHKITIQYLDDGVLRECVVKNLSDVEEIKDYEEPKTFWYMTAWGDVKEYSQDQFAIKQKQAIGNYFATKEETEKAVEKLKAWKRLKDAGCKIVGWDYSDNVDLNGCKFNDDDFIIGLSAGDIDEEDLDLLFGVNNEY